MQKKSKKNGVSNSSSLEEIQDQSSPQQQVLEAIKELPPKERLKVTRIVQSFSGPIPPASEMAKYKIVMKDFPSRILAMAEKEQENDMVRFQRFDAYKKRGQFFALLVVFWAFGLHAFLAYINHPIIGLTVSGTALISVVCAFIYGTRKDKKSS